MRCGLSGAPARGRRRGPGPEFVKVNCRLQLPSVSSAWLAEALAGAGACRAHKAHGIVWTGPEDVCRGDGLVRVPQPMKVIEVPGGGAAFVMEYLKIKSLSSQASKLGDQMADLHLFNQKLRETLKERESTVGHRAESAEPQCVSKFGFHTVTFCGFIPQVNEWQDDWPTFFTQHGLQAPLDLIEKDYGAREALELWSRLQVSRYSST